MERSTALELNRDISITATSNGPIVNLVFRTAGYAQDPISLSKAEAVKVAGDVRTKGSSDTIPCIEHLTDRDGAAFTEWLMNFIGLNEKAA